MAGTGSVKQELLARLEANPFDYDAHRELIHVVEDPKEKHDHRKKFQALFPLDESLWVKWLTDLDRPGQTFCDEQETAFWFETSLKDYLSPKLHVLHCKRIASKSKDVTFVREAFKSSSAKCGSHYTQGHLVWNAWIEFEQSQDAEDLEYVFRRRATSPLENLEMYWKEYSAKFGSKSEQYKSQFESVRSQVQERLENERAVKLARGHDVHENPGSALTAANTELEIAWIQFLDKERKAHPKKRATILFERALNDCCLSIPIWERYVTELEMNSDLVASADVCGRAIRNIPSGSGIIWAALIHLETSKSLDAARTMLRRCEQTFADSARWSESLESQLVFLRASFSEGKALIPALNDVNSCLEYYSLAEDDVAQAKATLLRLKAKWLLKEMRTNLKSAEELFGQYRTTWDDLHRLKPTSALLFNEHVAELKILGKDEEARECMNKSLHNLQGQPEAFAFMTESLLMEQELMGGSTADSFFKTKRGMDMKVAAVLKAHTRAAEDEKRSNKPQKAKARRNQDDGAEPETREMKKPLKKAKEESAAVLTEDGGDEGERSRKRPLNREEKHAIKQLSESDVIPARKIREHAARNDPSLVDIVFIPSLPDSATSESLQDFIERLVKVPGAFVKRVQIKTRLSLVNKATGEPLTKQYAFVEFGGDSVQVRNQAAKAAVKLSGSELDDTPLTILLSNPPASSKPQQFKRARTDSSSDAATDGASKDIEMQAANTVPSSSSSAAPAQPLKPRTLMVPRAVKVAQNKKS